MEGAYYLRKNSGPITTTTAASSAIGKVAAKKGENERRMKLATLDTNQRKTVKCEPAGAKKPPTKIPRGIPLHMRNAKNENKKQISKKTKLVEQVRQNGRSTSITTTTTTAAVTATTRLTTTAAATSTTHLTTAVSVTTTTTTGTHDGIRPDPPMRITRSKSIACEAPDPIVDIKTHRHERAKLTTDSDDFLSPDCISYFTSEIADSDINDRNDPQFCTEYIGDIYKHLLNTEREGVYKLQHNVLTRQIEGNLRRILLDWLVGVHLKFKFLPDTLHICIDILDRYLQKVTVSKKNLQLVGITALFIASKYEEIFPISITEYAYIAADTYTTEEIRKKEIDILTTLNYRLGKPNPLTFLRRYSKLMRTTTQIHNLAKYFIEVLYLSTEYCSLLPSQIAIGALVLAARVVNKGNREEGTEEEVWSPAMELHTWYSKERASIFMDKVLRGICGYYKHSSKESGFSRCTAIREKYSNGYLNVAALPRLRERLESLSKSQKN